MFGEPISGASVRGLGAAPRELSRIASYVRAAQHPDANAWLEANGATDGIICCLSGPVEGAVPELVRHGAGGGAGAAAEG